MVRYNKAEEQEIIRFMRYRNTDLTNIEQTFMTVSDIAKFINRSTMYVQSMCSKIIQEAKIKKVPLRMFTRKIKKQNYQ